jgi:hypothetical protein
LKSTTHAQRSAEAQFSQTGSPEVWNLLLAIAPRLPLLAAPRTRLYAQVLADAKARLPTQYVDRSAHLRLAQCLERLTPSQELSIGLLLFSLRDGRTATQALGPVSGLTAPMSSLFSEQTCVAPR